MTGAKGGIGKSVVAVNLAVALRLETGKSVALVDADTQFGDVSTLLDLTPALTAADVVRDPSRFDRARASGFLTRHSSGLDVLATSRDEDPWAGCPPDVWRQVIETLAQLYEFVVIDTSGAFDAFVRRVIETASLTLVVTTGEVSSVRDTDAGLKRLASWGVDSGNVRVLFNRGARAAGVAKKDIAGYIGAEVFWEVPDDGAVPYSVQVGQPVAMNPKNKGLGQNTRELARLIAGTRRSLVSQPQKLSLRRRLISLRGRNNDPGMAAVESDAQR